MVDSPSPARMLVADFDGQLRDGATFQLSRSHLELRDGDMIIFNYPNGPTTGINVESDADGLHSIIQLTPWAALRIGLEARGDGVYAFRPAPHHFEILPALDAAGLGVRLG